jgi:serine/threonine-protein kinase
MSNGNTSIPAQPPDLDVAQWRDVFGHLDALLDLPAEQRLAALGSGVVADDNGGVASVLRDFCERRAVTDAPETANIAAISQALLSGSRPEAGHRCGNYRLIEAIGQGGMGSVWRAERMDGLYQSEVAVKLLGSLALSAHARARFAREGEVLARLTHPNIARLLDAGLTEDYQRFLVLELVRGQDIEAYVKASALDQRAILMLFRQMLSAVAFAHSQLVVHRDIKPGNVMVTTDGQVKLLDFGVAKLIDADELEDNLTRVVGAAYTEAYAAPEQLRGDVVGTAADIFSLGCLLHQLLLGAVPQWPVAKRELKAGMQPQVAQPASATLPADLRAIVMKALAVAADERYTTAAAFDDDVARFLAGEVVRAQPATRLYQLRKFLSRHRWSALAGGAASLAVIASLGVALWQLQAAREQRTQALQEASRANEVTAFLTELFRASDLRMPSAQDKRTLTALQLLDAGREKLKTGLDDHPETKVALLGVLAEVYGIMGDGEKFVSLNEERIKLATERLGPEHPAALTGRFTDAEADLYSGNYDAARTTLLALQAPFRRVYGEQSERYAYWLATLADLERRARKEPIEQVLTRFERALAVFQRINSRSEEHGIAMQNYSTALDAASRFDASLAMGGKAIALLESLKNFDHGGLAIAYERRAQTLQKLGRHDQVEAEFDRAQALARESYGVTAAVYLNGLLSKAQWLHGRGRRAEAWALVDQVFATSRQPSSDTRGVPEQYFVRGSLLLDERRFGEAAADLTRAVEGWRTAGNNPSRLQRAEDALARAKAAVKS